MTLIFDLGGHAAVADAGRRPPSVYKVRRPCRSGDMAHDVCVSINGPGDLDLLTLKLVSKWH